MSNEQNSSIYSNSNKEQGGVKIETEVIIGIVRLNDKILSEANKLLSIWGMTVLQYNTLCILYSDGMNSEGLSSKEIGEKLYTRVPDVTRLLDRLADKDWITRERDTANRRIVRSRITKIGIKLVESSYKPMQELESQQFSLLTKEEKKTLASLLNKVI